MISDLPRCRAVTKFRTGTFGREACPCRWAAGPTGFCALHDPAVRLPRLLSRHDRLAADLARCTAEIDDLRTRAAAIAAIPIP